MPECLPRATEDLSQDESHLAQRGHTFRSLPLRLKIGALLTTSVMPRKRRETPAVIPIRNIAPKPIPGSPKHGRPESSDATQTSYRTSTPSSSKQSQAGSEAEPGSCGVPQCPIPNCKLETHRNYGRQRRALLLQQKIKSLPTPPLTEANSSLNLHSSIDPALVLPINDTPARDFHRLFAAFFQPRGPFERLVLIGRPTRQRDQSFKQTLYRLALKNSIYCMTMVALAHMEATKAHSGMIIDEKTEELTNAIYTKLLTMTREKVVNLDDDEEVDIDILIYAIVALCEFDLRLDRHDALRTHHNGLVALVAKKGGVHNLGLSLPYILRMDRFIAVRANDMPHFAPLELPDSEDLAKRLRSLDTHFGASLEEDDAVQLSEPVRSICVSAAYLLALMDDLKITFSPSEASEQPNPKLEYFYFLRENIEARHAVLNHQIHNALENASQSLASNPDQTPTFTTVRKNLLAITAMRVITYYVATGNYLPVVSDILASRVWNLLTPPSHSTAEGVKSTSIKTFTPVIALTDWTDDMPFLLWLLFACALPGSRHGTLTFVDHVSSRPLPPTLLQQSSSSSACIASGRIDEQSSSGGRSPLKPASGPRRIISPSSSRRDRHLHGFILYVAEHLVGERPLSGTDEWEEEVIEILEGFVWNHERLDDEFSEIMVRLHEGVLLRVDDETEDEEEEDDK